MDEFDLDRAAEVGWAGFLTRLAEHLVTLDEPLRVVPYGADDGDEDSFPVLLVEAHDDVLRARLLPGRQPWPDESRREQMLSLGWSEEPGGTAYLMRTPRAHAHLLAAALTDTLRKVVGAPHPAFLDAGMLSDTAPTGPDQPVTPVPEVELDTALRVTSPAELRQAVQEVLHAAMGHPPRHDADGDIPIVFGTTLLYVRTADAQPVVSLFAVVVQDIGDLDVARREVGILNAGGPSSASSTWSVTRSSPAWRSKPCPSCRGTWSGCSSSWARSWTGWTTRSRSGCGAGGGST